MFESFSMLLAHLWGWDDGASCGSFIRMIAFQPLSRNPLHLAMLVFSSDASQVQAKSVVVFEELVFFFLVVFAPSFSAHPV